ncbi:MAG TPA: hypothetical protein VKG24_00390 [Pseudolabrys sp.]|nr:hypothetical protein [Pseudolabrys sp.]
MAPLLVRLDRDMDREAPCCTNIAECRPGRGPHAAELCCAGCGRHRAWLPRQALDFVTTTVSRFGAPAEPITLRNSSIGDHAMAKTEYDNTNRGALFRDEEKHKDTDRDYSGTINIEGHEFWLSGWIKTSKKGTRFLSLSVKPKNAPAAKSTKSRAEDMNDDIPF